MPLLPDFRILRIRKIPFRIRTIWLGRIAYKYLDADHVEKKEYQRSLSEPVVLPSQSGTKRIQTSVSFFRNIFSVLKYHYIFQSIETVVIPSEVLTSAKLREMSTNPIEFFFGSHTRPM